MKISVNYLKRVFLNELRVTMEDGKEYVGKIVSYNNYPGDINDVKEISMSIDLVPVLGIQVNEIVSIEELTSQEK